MQHVITQGAEIPALGLGVFRMSDIEVEAMVPAAAEIGFRHFDTAQIYGNEAALGKALKQTGLPRSEVFLTTKVWVDNYTSELFLRSVEESLQHLQVSQVDLLLAHWPGETVAIEQQVTWLNEAKEAGLARYIGVSNYNAQQFEEAIRVSEAPIITNQIEMHPYLDQSRMEEVARRNHTSLTAYFGMADGRVPNDPLLQEIGKTYGKTAAQVGLRWLLQKGVITLSKSIKAERLLENFNVFDFALSQADINRINALQTENQRLVSPENLAPDWSL